MGFEVRAVLRFRGRPEERRPRGTGLLLTLLVLVAAALVGGLTSLHAMAAVERAAEKADGTTAPADVSEQLTFTEPELAVDGTAPFATPDRVRMVPVKFAPAPGSATVPPRG